MRANPDDYGRLNDGDILEIKGVKNALKGETGSLTINNVILNFNFSALDDLFEREREIVLLGCKLSFTVVSS